MQTSNILFGFTLFMGVFVANGQIPEIQWQNTIGGNHSDQLSVFLPGLDGGYLLAGTSQSDIGGDKLENSLGYDFWVVKIDDGGDIVWQNTIGGNNTDQLTCVAAVADGYVLGGYSQSGVSGDKTQVCKGSYDFWIVKINEFGEIQWQHTLGGSSPDYLYSIITTSDGGLLLGGVSSSGISGDKTEASLGSGDYWVIKTDAFGDILWQNTIGGADYDYLSVITETSPGNYIIAGYTYSGLSGDKTSINFGSTDAWIVAIDAIGTVLWDAAMGGANAEYLYTVNRVDDNGFLLGITSWSGISGNKTEASKGASDIWLLRTDETGMILWQKVIGGSLEDAIDACVSAPTGWIIAGTSNSGISGDKTQASEGFTDFWILEIDTSGILLAQEVIGAEGNDELSTLIITPDSGIAIGGSSASEATGDKSEGNIGEWDYWVLKLHEDAICISLVGLTSATLSTKAKVSWDDVPSALTYRIRYRSGDAEPWQYKIAYAGKNSIVLKPLVCNTTYEWQIMSICSEVDAIHSEYSASAWFTTLACKEGEEINPEITIFPNPANSILNIHGNWNSGAVKVILTDLEGREVSNYQTEISENGQIKMHVQGIAAGLYTIQIISENEITKELVIIVH